MEIHTDKAVSGRLPIKEFEGVPITLVIGGRSYEAGLRSTAGCNYAWVSPDLTDADGRGTMLAYVLPAAGLVKNQQVELDVFGRVAALNTSSRLSNYGGQVDKGNQPRD